MKRQLKWWNILLIVLAVVVVIAAAGPIIFFARKAVLTRPVENPVDSKLAIESAQAPWAVAMRRAWEVYLIGDTEDIAARLDDPGVMQYVASVQNVARTGQLSADNLGGYNGMRALAMVYRTPGTDYYQDQELLDKLIGALESEYKKSYHIPADGSMGGNWWNVEVGAPLRMLDTITLIYDDMYARLGAEEAAARITKYTDVVDYYQDAYETSSNGQPETAANLVWSSSNLILAGVLSGRYEFVEEGLHGRNRTVTYSARSMENPAGSPVTATTNNGGLCAAFGDKGARAYSLGSAELEVNDDGFHSDGSFIQHYLFAYNGGYGKHFINIISGVLYAYRDIDPDYFDIGTEAKEYLFNAVFEAYEPLIYNGSFMDMVRGREINTYSYNDEIAGRHVIRSIAYLSELMPEPQKSRAQSMIKYWLAQNDTGENILYDPEGGLEYNTQGSVIKILENIMENDAIEERGELLLHKNYTSMAKVVHLSEGFGLGISMYSPEIGRFENISTSTSKLWHISDGMTYIYTADADQYNSGYHETVDPLRYPGITVDRNEDRLDVRYNSNMNIVMNTPSVLNEYDWVGGTNIDCRYGIAGFRYKGFGSDNSNLITDLDVKKSWFMFDDEVVCVGSGITSSSGDEIETIVDNRKLLPENTNSLMIDGKGFHDNGSMSYHNVHTVTLTGNTAEGSDMGYYFPNGTSLNVLRETRTGNGKAVNFATMWIPHGVTPLDASYSYVLLPGKTAGETAAYAKRPDIELLEVSKSAHAVRENKLGILGVNFWEDADYTTAGVTSNAQSSVMVRETADGYQISVSDPTQSGKNINLIFSDISASSVTCQDDEIKIVGLSPLTISVDTSGTGRGTIRLEVEK